MMQIILEGFRGSGLSLILVEQTATGCIVTIYDPLATAIETIRSSSCQKS